ncbi:MAG: hypothetical protein WC121_06020 [Candidatus Kapaibacterium sp.]
MKFIFILIFILAQSFSYSNKPFSTWQLDSREQIKFGEEECQYTIDIDNYKKDRNYRHSDIFTDDKGEIQLSFDIYSNKIVIRESTGLIIFEHLFDNQEVNTNIESIVLPFYSKRLCYFVYISTKETDNYGTLNYIKIDYNSPFNTIIPETSIATSISSLPLAATLSNDGNSYFIASMAKNPEELHITQLFSSEAFVNTRFQDIDMDYNNKVFSGIAFKFSPQGDKLILNYYGSNFVFYSFDNSNGNIIQNYKIDFTKESDYNIRTMFEFSQNGSKLYAQSGHDNYIIHQFDLKDYTNKNSVLNSRKIVWIQEATCVDCLLRDFQLAPNNRIYISYLHSYTGRKDSTFLGVINCPNSESPNVGYQHLGIGVTNNIINVLYIPKIPSNFLATPQSPAVYNRPDDIQQYCINSSVTIKGAEDPCGVHSWVKADGSRDYSNDLVFENISAADAGYYFYHFQSCYKQFNDTFEIRIIEKITPEIVKVFPDKLDLCLTPLEDMTFTSTEKYKEYKWYFTKSGTTNRILIGSQDTVVIADLGLLELEALDEGGCEGIASYIIEQAIFDYPQIEEYEIRICRGIEQSYSIDFPIKSNKSLRIDSLSLRLGNKMSIKNKPFIIDSYPNGEFYRDILIDFDRLNVGILMDTLDIYIDSECKRKISIPLKIIIESIIFTLEVPHLRTVIGRRNFEIPIFLTTTCIEATDDFKFEASFVLSNSKYLVDRVEGVKLIDISVVNDNQKIKISYEGTAISNGRNQIGSLFGTVLLTDIDSTEILIQDTVSNYVFDIIDGSLITEEICAQDIRQVLFFNNQTDISNNGKSIYLNSLGGYRGNLYLRITNYTGHTVAEYNINKDDETIERNWELTGIASGIYFLQIMEGNKMEVNKLFIE